MKPILPPWPTFDSEDSRVDLPNRHPLYEAMYVTPLSERYELVIEVEGELRFPPAVQEALKLEPGDLLALERNELSIRLAPCSELLTELRQSGHVQGPYIEEWLGLTLEAVGSDGGVAIPADFLALHAGDRLTLEVVSQGLQYTLYIYPVDA